MQKQTLQRRLFWTKSKSVKLRHVPDEILKKETKLKTDLQYTPCLRLHAASDFLRQRWRLDTTSFRHQMSLEGAVLFYPAKHVSN